MKLNLEWTPEIVSSRGQPCRVWKGTTDTGIECFALIAVIAVANQHDLSEFELLLKQLAAPVLESVEVTADPCSFAKYFPTRKPT